MKLKADLLGDNNLAKNSHETTSKMPSLNWNYLYHIPFSYVHPSQSLCCFYLY